MKLLYLIRVTKHPMYLRVPRQKKCYSSIGTIHVVVASPIIVIEA